MSRREWLKNVIDTQGFTKGVELGVLKGPTFKYLIGNCPNLHLTGIDVFFPDRRWKAQKISTNEELLKTEPVSWYDTLIEFCLPYGPRANIMRSFTVEAAASFEDDSLDFVFIDADHSYEGVKQDIKHWLPKVKKGGLVSGHDLHMLEVRQAVMQFNMNFQEGPDNVWYWIKE